MGISEKVIQDMQRQIDACSSYIDALAQSSCHSPEKVNGLMKITRFTLFILGRKYQNF